MRIAIVHYHLNPGGVTTVINATLSALSEAGIPHIILTDGTYEDLPNHRTVPGLGYLTNPGNHTPSELCSRLRGLASDLLGGPPDVWHFHNHSLGKNCLLPNVVSQLCAENEALVLQIHDLAEQGRPENYPMISGIAELYPISSRIRYAFLNSRDFEQFTHAGLPAENALLLPNPICIPPLNTTTANNDPLVFAPIRGIRRKNLGELVLLSALAPRGTRFAVSQAPTNPRALPIHDHWRDFSLKHGLPIGFGVVDHFAPVSGARTDYETWLQHTSHFITTSVSEGFGLTFLESIARGKPLIGRNLPHISRDHLRNGIRAGRLYDSILIPNDWVELPLLRDHLTLDMERDYRLYQRPLTSQMIENALSAIVCDGHVDFGNLPEPIQQAIIEKLSDPSARSIPMIRTCNGLQATKEWLSASLSARDPTATPDQLSCYSAESYQKSLLNLYKEVSRAPVSAVYHLPADKILTNQLRPENFHFLLSSLRENSAPKKRYRAVIFDIYGTLLIASPGGVKPDPLNDPVLRDVLREFGNQPSKSPSTDLHNAVLRHHAASDIDHPEIDIRELWREVLGLSDEIEMTPLVQALEDAWHPAKSMPGAHTFIKNLARRGISLGILSNAQCNTLPSLGPIVDLFSPEFILLSYQHGIAKPSAGLFSMLTDRLAGRSISPQETLFIGNDPLHDITPAAKAGFNTALFVGHPESLRKGECVPDHIFSRWSELNKWFQ